MPKTPGEWARFEALLALANEESWRRSSAPDAGLEMGGAKSPIPNLQSQVYGFRPSVLIQQTFSLLKQSPTGTIRLADLRRIAPAEVTSETIRKIMAQLTFAGYLKSGRLGEWKPDEKLQELFDQHEIYSNIGADVLGITAVDAHTGRLIAHTERNYAPGTVVLFGGKAMKVAWSERFRFGLTPAPGAPVDDILRFRKSYAAIPFNITQTVARSLNIPEHMMVTLPQDPGFFLFHFWGTIWGELLTAVLITQGISAEPVNEYCLYVRHPLKQLPPCNEKSLTKSAHNIVVMAANRLAMGRFHSLLSADVAATATSKQLHLSLFYKLYTQVNVKTNPEIYEQLHSLLQT
jgi:hypothetical protein